jgi:uncharacterized protein (TIGR00255 family)
LTPVFFRSMLFAEAVKRVEWDYPSLYRNGHSNTVRGWELLRSMTGFGRGEVEAKGVRVTVELRSLNSRFLEISPKIPKFLATLETDIKQRIQRDISRGRILVNVSWDEAGGVSESIKLDQAAADRYHGLLEALKARYDLAGDIDVATLAAFPDLFKHEVEEWEPAEAMPLVGQAMDAAIAELMEMKTREGGTIAEDLRGRIDDTVSHLEEVKVRARGRVEALREKLRLRLSELTEKGEFDEALLTQEVVLFAEKSDCTEECVRYRIHCENFNHYLSEGGAVGRKLNFLLQEMAREANTMAVKAGDAEVSGIVVLIKEELEKIREQVQNIE